MNFLNQWLSSSIRVSQTLLLRPFTLDDAPAYWRLIHDNASFFADDFSPMVQKTLTLEGTIARIRQRIQLFAERASFSYGIFYHERLVGDVANGGYHGLNLNPKQTVQLCYYLAEDTCGQGVARRAVKAVIDELFRNTQYPGVAVEIRPENARSINLVLKLGFEYVYDCSNKHVYALPRPGKTIQSMPDLLM